MKFLPPNQRGGRRENQAKENTTYWLLWRFSDPAMLWSVVFANMRLFPNLFAVAPATTVRPVPFLKTSQLAKLTVEPAANAERPVPLLDRVQPTAFTTDVFSATTA